MILLDLQLPGMSGAQTVAALRGHEVTSSIPVVVLSVLPRSAEQMADGAFVDWIEKPADPDALVAALDAAIGNADDAFRALFIERDPAVAELLRALLERHGVASFRAENGPQALSMCGQIRPDVLLLDDDLPAIGGLDVQSWLRGQSAFDGRLPMIAYDARHLEAAEDQRRSTGAVAQILTKGQVSAEEFQWRVMTLLARPHIASRIAEASP